MSAPARTLAMGQDEAGTGRPTVDAPFGRALKALGEKRSEIVGLTADLGKYTDILPFRDAFPDRFFNVGMAEQNLVAVAAGLARTGLIPYATTYGVFATRRAFDFVAIACAHSNLKVKIVAGLPGLTTGYGGTHQAIEDLALMLARNANGRPKAIVLRTLPGKGVPRIETSERSHFFRVDVSQWNSIIDEFEQRAGADA
jgi:transketolase